MLQRFVNISKKMKRVEILKHHLSQAKGCNEK